MTPWIVVFLVLVTSQKVNGGLELETSDSSVGALRTLRNGREIPVIGLRAPPELLAWAFRLGYRMTETNHRSASEALRETQLPRGALFVSTQLSSHGFDEAHRAIRHSLRQLRLDYVDLLLLASPWEGKLMETWDAMVEMNKMGLVRSLAVRDFDIHHLETFASHGRPLPEVLQLELHRSIFNKEQNWFNGAKIIRFKSKPPVPSQHSLDYPHPWRFHQREEWVQHKFFSVGLCKWASKLCPGVAGKSILKRTFKYLQTLVSSSHQKKWGRYLIWKETWGCIL